MNRATFNLLFISIILFLIAAAAAGGMLYVQEKKGSSLLQQMQSIRDQERLERAYADLETEWIATAGDRERLHSMVMDGENDTINFLAVIDGLADHAGVTITTDLMSNKTGETGFDELIGTFSLHGSADAVINLVRKIELLPYDIQVSSLRFTRAGSSGDAVLVLKIGVKE